MNDVPTAGVGYFVRTAARVLRRPRLRRDVGAVLDEYSAGWEAYRRHLDAAASLDDWLFVHGVDDAPRYCRRDGVLEFSGFNSALYYRDVLLATLARHFPAATSVAEFGSGLGRNLLFLKRERPELRLSGFELCMPGVEIGRRAAEKFALDVSFTQFDFSKAEAADAALPVCDVAFTMFALEQVPRGILSVLDRILRRARLGSIHIEPVTENYPWSPLGLLGRLDHWKVDYLAGFPEAASKLGVKVTHRPLAGSHNPLMFPSVYVLERGLLPGSAGARV